MADVPSAAEWRENMGIEPTEDNASYPPNRFEACGAHQELRFSRLIL